MKRKQSGTIKASPERLTPKQVDLLAHLMIRSYSSPGSGGTKGGPPDNQQPITWSPKAYLGRSPTKSESASLSRRLSTLVERGLVSQRGRRVIPTEYGKSLLQEYVLNNEPQGGFHTLRLFLDLDESNENMKAITKAMNLAKERGRTELLNGGLQELYFDELKRAGDIIKQLQGGQAHQLEEIGTGNR